MYTLRIDLPAGGAYDGRYTGFWRGGSQPGEGVVNWLWVAGVSFLIYAAIFLYCAWKRKWSPAGLAVGVANFLVVLLHLVAPI